MPVGCDIKAGGEIVVLNVGAMAAGGEELVVVTDNRSGLCCSNR